MAQTAEAQIEIALETRLQSLVTAPVLPISWTGKSFTAPANGKYLEVIYSPNGAERWFIAGEDEHQHLGVLQINLHWPHGDFERVMRDVAAQVAAHFPADLRLRESGVEVRVTKRPDVRPALVGTKDVVIPIEILFEAWA